MYVVHVSYCKLKFLLDAMFWMHGWAGYCCYASLETSFLLDAAVFEENMSRSESSRWNTTTTQCEEMWIILFQEPMCESNLKDRKRLHQLIATSCHGSGYFRQQYVLGLIWKFCYCSNLLQLLGQIIRTSAEVTLNGGLVESPPKSIHSGLGIILICRRIM